MRIFFPILTQWWCLAWVLVSCLHQHHWVQDFFFCLLCSLKSCSFCIFYFSIDIVYCISTARVIPNKAVKKIVISVQYSVWYYCQIRENSSNNQGLLELSILSLYSYDPNQYWYSKRKLVASDSQGQKG